MTKPLDKHTKAELLAHIATLDARLAQSSTALAEFHGQKLVLAQRNEDLTERVEDLLNQLDALETRRRYEAAAFAAKLRKTKSGERTHKDWAALAKQYCAQFGVSTVSRTDLVRFAENART